jgi:hypothetical protein
MTASFPYTINEKTERIHKKTDKKNFQKPLKNRKYVKKTLLKPIKNLLDSARFH